MASEALIDGRCGDVAVVAEDARGRDVEKGCPERAVENCRTIMAAENMGRSSGSWPSLEARGRVFCLAADLPRSDRPTGHRNTREPERIRNLSKRARRGRFHRSSLFFSVWPGRAPPRKRFLPHRFATPEGECGRPNVQPS